MESSFSYLMMALAMGGPISLIAFFAIQKSKKTKQKTRDALFQLGFGYKKHDTQGRRDAPQEIEFSNKKDQLIFHRFNYGMSTLDFYKHQQALEELFESEFVNFERADKFKLIARKADFESPIIKSRAELTDILIGSDGVQKTGFDENRSAFLFALSGTGKTHLVKNCFLKQFAKLDAKIYIITSKKSDFDGAYSYHNPKDLETFKAILATTEANRLLWEETGYRNKKHIVFIFDEVQEVNDDPEITAIIRSFVRVGRSQNIWTILASQSGTVTALRNIEINLIPIKIAVRFTESVAFASTIFTPELAAKSHHIKQPFGFGYAKTPSFIGGKVKFYYEP